MRKIVFYRISDNGRNSEINSDIKRNLLLRFLSEFKSFEIVIVADNCSEKLSEYLSLLNLTCYFTALGNRKSFLFCLSLAEKIDDNETIIFFVEDDYYFKQNISSKLVEALRFFDYVSFYEHPDKIIISDSEVVNRSIYCDGSFSEPTRLVQIDNEFWRTTSSTTMTFAVSAKTLKHDIFWWRINIGKSFLPLDMRCWIFLTKPQIPSLKNVHIINYSKHLIFSLISALFQKKRTLGIPLFCTYAIHLDKTVEGVDRIGHILDGLNK